MIDEILDALASTSFSTISTIKPVSPDTSYLYVSFLSGNVEDSGGSEYDIVWRVGIQYFGTDYSEVPDKVYEIKEAMEASDLQLVKFTSYEVDITGDWFLITVVYEISELI